MHGLAAAFNSLMKKFPGYETRHQQVQMAEEVFTCLRNKGRLIIEAGTGVGKSFAYLIPAILSNEKTIISTASIALQDQLVHKDLEFLQRILPQKFSFAILKGKNNYLCLKREREFQPEIEGYRSEPGNSYKRFLEWLSETETGDRDELHFMPDFWPRVCGDSDDCNVAQCPFYRECFYYMHYRNLYKKDLLVVNHHLLVYDLLSGFNLLPFHSQLILDEAHHIEKVISHATGTMLNYSRFMWLLYRLRGLKIAVDSLFEPVESFFKRRDMNSQTTAPVSDAVTEALRNLKTLFAFDNVIHRLKDSKESLSGDEIRDRIETTIGYLRSLEGIIDDFIEQANDNKVYYMTASSKGLEIRSSLVECQGPFAELSSGYDSLIMTSATLTTGGDFGFFKQRLGMTDSQSGSVTSFKEMIIGSPFDFKNQAILYIEKDLPSPVRKNSEDFMNESIPVIERLINTSRGRALVLFTSYNHLRLVAENIRIDYPCKSQGDMPPAQLIRWFKKTDNPVLLATATFWQGIDVKGQKLSMVIIMKLPFGAPGDPVYDEKCRRLGERWFSDLALPSAILILKQGIGRLIRGSDDYGVTAILDSRLITSSYGRAIISSLPDMNIVLGIEDVQSFFDNAPACIPQRISEFPHNEFVAGESYSTVIDPGNPNDPSTRKIGRANRERFGFIIDNPDEKDYNVELAQRLVKKVIDSS